LNDIVNSSFNLGEKIPKNRIVKKVMWSLPNRFRPKVSSIKESKDLDIMRIEELVNPFRPNSPCLNPRKRTKLRKHLGKMPVTFPMRNPLMMRTWRCLPRD
jgi:hypothetical protein